METIINSYQIIAEILEPITGTLLYSKVEPYVAKFQLRREIISDYQVFNRMLDIQGELLSLETKKDHPSERSWFNYESFKDKQKNEIIHIDMEDGMVNTDDKNSYVNCHIIIRNNKDGSVLYEFGSRKEK